MKGASSPIGHGDAIDEPFEKPVVDLEVVDPLVSHTSVVIDKQLSETACRLPRALRVLELPQAPQCVPIRR
jgi:hypothetical protein